MNLRQKLEHNAALRELEKQEVPCCECGKPMSAAGEGVCYQCRCELHSIGECDDDNDPFRGPVYMEITEADYFAQDAEDEARAEREWAEAHPAEAAAELAAIQELLSSPDIRCDDSDIPF